MCTHIPSVSSPEAYNSPRVERAPYLGDEGRGTCGETARAYQVIDAASKVRTARFDGLHRRLDDDFRQRPIEIDPTAQLFAERAHVSEPRYPRFFDRRSPKPPAPFFSRSLAWSIIASFDSTAST
jgi:hypothetical protein